MRTTNLAGKKGDDGMQASSRPLVFSPSGLVGFFSMPRRAEMHAKLYFAKTGLYIYRRYCAKFQDYTTSPDLSSDTAETMQS